MGCCGGGHNQSGNNDNNNGHGGRRFSLCHIILIVGIVLLIAKAVF
jgi:hypothetical protein